MMKWKGCERNNYGEMTAKTEENDKHCQQQQTAHGSITEAENL